MSKESKITPDTAATLIGLDKDAKGWASANSDLLCGLYEPDWDQVVDVLTKAKRVKGIMVTIDVSVEIGKNKLTRLLKWGFDIHSCAALNQPTLLYRLWNNSPPTSCPKIYSVGLVFDPLKRICTPLNERLMQYGDPPNFLHHDLQQACGDKNAKIQYIDTVAQIWNVKTCSFANLDVYELLEGSIDNPERKSVEEMQEQVRGVFGPKASSAFLLALPGPRSNRIRRSPYEWLEPQYVRVTTQYSA